MPESLATDSKEVAMIMAATELTKIMGSKLPPEKVADRYRETYKAIMEAYHEVHRDVHKAASFPQD